MQYTFLRFTLDLLVRLKVTFILTGCEIIIIINNNNNNIEPITDRYWTDGKDKRYSQNLEPSWELPWIGVVDVMDNDSSAIVGH